VLTLVVAAARPQWNPVGQAFFASFAAAAVAYLAFAAVVTFAGPLLVGLLTWQGAIYACAPLMAWPNLHTKLSAQLERRRRTEQLRERAAQLAPYGTGAAAGFAAAAVLAALMVAGGANQRAVTRGVGAALAGYPDATTSRRADGRTPWRSR
jgi:hypothetical protein